MAQTLTSGDQSPAEKTQSEDVITAQQTLKQDKLAKLVSFGVVFAGVLSAMAGFGTFGVFLIVLGLIMAAVASFGAWWHTG